MGDGLVEQGKRVAHRALGGAGDQRQRIVVDLDLLQVADRGEVADQHVGLDPAQVEAQAARAHRHRHFFDLGGREQELDVFRRLFQRLQQAVESRLGQHVHFVDDIDLGPRHHRHVARAFDDLADVVDAGVRGRVHLDDVDMARFQDRLAMHAEFVHVDGRPVDGGPPVARGKFVIEGAGEDARGRGLADAAHAREHIGLMDAADVEGVGQGADHRLLADQILETARPIFARQHAIDARRWILERWIWGRRFRLRIGEQAAGRVFTLIWRGIVVHRTAEKGRQRSSGAQILKGGRLDEDPPVLVRAASFRT